MALVSWHALNTLYQNLNDWLRHFNQDECASTLWMIDRPPLDHTQCKFICSSQVEMQETVAEIILGVKIPDVVATSLDLQITEESICIQGEQLRPLTAKSNHRVEPCPQQFQYLIPLPHAIQTETAIAELNGDYLVFILQKSRFPRLWIQINFSRSSKMLLDRCFQKTPCSWKRPEHGEEMA